VATPAKPKPSLKDVAALAGVSTATVSFVLNDSKPVAAATRARVKRALATLDYRISPSARALRTGRHHAIGLLLPDLINPFFPALAQAVTASAWARGHALILASSGDTATEEMQAYQALIERTDGVIWIPSAAAKVTGAVTPTVILDRPSALLAAYDSVSADHRAGGALAAGLFRTQGRRHVGLLTGPTHSPSAVSRQQGFRDHLDGMDVLWQHEVPFALDLPVSVTSLLAEPRLQAVFAASDVVAIGAIRILRSLGRQVPGDVAVIGFDDIPWAALIEPALTTIRQPVAELGECAVVTLIKRIGHPDMKPSHQLLPVTLVERASTAMQPVKPSRTTTRKKGVR
jgi:LacI family transcriptional regulator